MSHPPDEPKPLPADVVSPTDSTDREQSDADDAANRARNRDDREQSDADAAAGRKQLAEASEASLAATAITGAKIDQLVISSNALAQAVIESAETARTSRRRYGVTLTAIAATMLIGFAGVGAALYQGAKGRAQIQDCVQPTGQCFRDASARTADVVGNLNKVSELAAGCARYYGPPLTIQQSVTAIEACVLRALTP